eukprot:TRINITY_DN54535_c0_g1_i1.p1 TRINITY_DN54535_c0_g1~~TRINITY_DN54535_c0_g1_i1.p1  ORF type:complete len:355 (+),score=62.24 TRINITY_DN54535_c0_g1_i1:125-1189(+)
MLSTYCRSLQALREAAHLRQAPQSSQAGLAPCPQAEAEIETLLLTLGRISELQVCRQVLLKTGIGREVNHRFLRMHPCAAVRDFSRGIVCSWRAAVKKERNICSPRCAQQKDRGTKSASKRSDISGEESFCDKNASGTGAQATSSLLRSGGLNQAVIVIDEDEQDAQRTGIEAAHTPNLAAKPESNNSEKAVADMSEWSVMQLKARIRELGLSSVGCTERQDLLLLLSKAEVKDHGQTSHMLSGKLKRRMTLGRAATSRLSLLRRMHPGSEASQAAKSSQVLSQRRELERVMRAKTSASLLGLREQETRNSCLVRQRFRELSRLVHPDKCPLELRPVATQAFGKLKAAVGKLLR